MNTALTELLGIDYPILNAGMEGVATPIMVAAVCEAGGFGVLGAGASPPNKTRQMIREVRNLTDKPFGINCPLAVPNGVDNAKVAIEEQVRVVNYSMGRGDWIVSPVREYGGKVIASVNSIELAIKAREQGADAVIAAGHEAAGHSGDIATFVFIPRLVELLDIPIIAAGGIANGKGLLAALALGASGVSMGTRFWTAKEGPTHVNWKKLALDSEASDTLYSERFDGIPSRQMNTALARKLHRAPLNYLRVLREFPRIARDLDQPYFSLLLSVLVRGPRAIDAMSRMALALRAHQVTLTTGDLETGMTSAGQSVGLVHDMAGIADVIQTIVQEAESGQKNLNEKVF